MNWAEASGKLRAYGITPTIVRHALAAVDAEIASFAESDADAVADLTPRTRSLGLSLADRACIALALATGAPALTAERALAAGRVEAIHRATALRSLPISGAAADQTVRAGMSAGLLPSRCEGPLEPPGRLVGEPGSEAAAGDQ